MRDGHGRVLGEQKLHQRLADDVGAADHHRIEPAQRRMHRLGELDAADRRTRRQRRQARRQPTGIERMKAIDVLGRIDGGDDARRIDLRRQRQLHQDAVHGGIGVELADKTEQLVGAGRGRQMKIERLHADFDDGARLAADIGFARRIFADQDHRQAGNETLRGRQAPRLRRHGGAQLRGDRLAVDDAGSHGVQKTFGRI